MKARFLAVNPMLDSWEGETDDFEQLRQGAFADDNSFGFAVSNEQDGSEKFYYFGEVMSVSEVALHLAERGNEAASYVDAFLKTAAQNGTTHYVRTRNGNFGPLGDDTVVYDAKTGSDLLWPKQKTTVRPAPKAPRP